MDKLYKWNTKEYNFIELSSGRRSALRARLKKLVQMTKKFFLLSLWIIPRRARFLYNNKKIPTVSFRSDCSRRKEKKTAEIADICRKWWTYSNFKFHSRHIE